MLQAKRISALAQVVYWNKSSWRYSMTLQVGVALQHDVTIVLEHKCFKWKNKVESWKFQESYLNISRVKIQIVPSCPMEAFSKIKMTAVGHVENSKIIVQTCVCVIHVHWLFLGCIIHWWCSFYHRISGFRTFQDGGFGYIRISKIYYHNEGVKWLCFIGMFDTCNKTK